MSDFCIFVAMHKGDYLYAKNLCQSIRYFCGDVPIVLLKDGNFSTKQLQSLGSIYEFDPATVPPRVRHLRGIYARLKAFFDSRFKYFLYLDADIILLNDIRQLPFRDYDMLVSPRPKYLSNPEKQTTLANIYFDYERIKTYDQNFDPTTMILFNCGQFFARTGIIPADELLLHYNYQRAAPKCVSALPNADQSLLNYLINKLRQEGKLNLGAIPFALMADQTSPTQFSTPDSFSDLTRENILARRYTQRYLIHYVGPSRRPRFSANNYGWILSEFYRLYYRHFPFHVRLWDELRRGPAVLFKIVYRYYKNNMRHYVRS